MNILLDFHEFPENFLIINNNWIMDSTSNSIKEKKSNLDPQKTQAIITSSDLFYTKPVKKLNTLPSFICVTLSN